VLGVPLLDNFNDADVTSDMGMEASSTWSATTDYKKGNFVSVYNTANVESVYVAASDNKNLNPTTNPTEWDLKWTEPSVSLDPRIDWTVGRRGLPYLDWGVHPGKTYVRDQAYGGPYSPKKHVMYRSDVGTNTFAGNPRLNANNYRMIRYSHVLLWLAEIEVEIGSLEDAREYVNKIRRRAANVDGFVKNADGTNAANYVIKEYLAPWTDQAIARKAVQFEERLEFAMEGHRRFDLVRWNIADQTLNAYYLVEGTKRSYLNGVLFVNGKHEYFPIPLQEILNSQVAGKVTLTQNPLY
jgi:hypothetical protein